jgi:hypothetical protein
MEEQLLFHLLPESLPQALTPDDSLASGRHPLKGFSHHQAYIYCIKSIAIPQGEDA